jgi:hypothetical protein
MRRQATDWGKYFQKKYLTKICREARRWWLTPVILAIQETEIRRITVRSQPGQIAHRTRSQKHPTQRAGGVAQVVECLPSKHEAQS